MTTNLGIGQTDTELETNINTIERCIERFELSVTQYFDKGEIACMKVLLKELKGEE